MKMSGYCSRLRKSGNGKGWSRGMQPATRPAPTVCVSSPFICKHEMQHAAQAPDSRRAFLAPAVRDRQAR